MVSDDSSAFGGIDLGPLLFLELASHDFDILFETTRADLVDCCLRERDTRAHGIEVRCAAGGALETTTGDHDWDGRFLVIMVSFETFVCLKKRRRLT